MGIHHLSRLLANKFVRCLLLQRADPCELARSVQGSMISDSTEKSCLRVNASGAENSIDGRLHLPTLCHPVHRWRAHGAIRVQRPWISCCGNDGNIISSPSVTVAMAAALFSGGNGGGGGGGGGIWLEVEQ